jgi:hypothetical protein
MGGPPGTEWPYRSPKAELANRRFGSIDDSTTPPESGKQVHVRKPEVQPFSLFQALLLCTEPICRDFPSPVQRIEMLSRDGDGLNNAILVQPSLTPSDLSVHVFANLPRAFNAQSLTSTGQAHMNRLGPPIVIIIFKNADLCGHGRL